MFCYILRSKPKMCAARKQNSMQNAGYANFTCVFYTSVDDNFFCGHGETYFDTKSARLKRTSHFPKPQMRFFRRAAQNTARFLWNIPAFWPRFFKNRCCKGKVPHNPLKCIKFGIIYGMKRKNAENSRNLPKWICKNIQCQRIRKFVRYFHLCKIFANCTERRKKVP